MKTRVIAWWSGGIASAYAVYIALQIYKNVVIVFQDTDNEDQAENGGLVFLKPHPKYPNMKDLSMMKGRKVESLIECNGFCKTIS